MFETLKKIEVRFSRWFIGFLIKRLKRYEPIVLFYPLNSYGSLVMYTKGIAVKDIEDILQDDIDRIIPKHYQKNCIRYYHDRNGCKSGWRYIPFDYRAEYSRLCVEGLIDAKT